MFWQNCCCPSVGQRGVAVAWAVPRSAPGSPLWSANSERSNSTGSFSTEMPTGVGHMNDGCAAGSVHQPSLSAKYDPTAEVAKVRLPVLIIQGGRDVQISEADARALKAAHPAAKLVIIPEANHVFRAAPNNDRMAQLKLYTDPTIPIVPELAPAIAEWIKKLK